jgi:hypothetical protein
MQIIFIPHRKHAYLWVSTACYGDSFILFYVDDVRTSQETHLRASTAYYGVSFTLLYIDYVRTSQEAYLLASTACYGNRFSFCSYLTGNIRIGLHGLLREHIFF